jgi:hypothetical protein
MTENEIQSAIAQIKERIKDAPAPGGLHFKLTADTPRGAVEEVLDFLKELQLWYVTTGFGRGPNDVQQHIAGGASLIATEIELRKGLE